MYITLNSQYAIRNEPTCSFLVKLSTVVDSHIASNSPLVTLLPPFIGYILSNIGEYEFNESLDIISKSIGVSIESINNFVVQLIENENCFSFKMNNDEFFIPKRTLVKSAKKIELKRYTDPNIDIFGEFKAHRPSIPFNINFMITTKCNTNCIYCYADKSRKDDLSIDYIKKILYDAHNIGIINLTLTGGDVLAHPEWRSILSIASQLGFSLFISTKTTLSKDDVTFLKDIGVKMIQISLDSLDCIVLQKMLHVNSSYKNKMLRTLKYFDDAGMKVIIRTVLTKFNSDEKSIKDMIEHFNKLSCIDSWVITPAFISEYKKEYDNYSVSKNMLKSIYSYTNVIKSYFPILYNKINESGYSLIKFDTVEDFISKNQNCYANSYSMSIISNGKVSICEMLYETSQFIIGDIRKNSLKDIWNSEKAISLFLNERKCETNTTPCYECSVYDVCKQRLAKKVCYVDIVKAYGVDHIDYPDIRCPYSMKYDEKYIF